MNNDFAFVVRALEISCLDHFRRLKFHLLKQQTMLAHEIVRQKIAKEISVKMC